MFYRLAQYSLRWFSFFALCVGLQLPRVQADDQMTDPFIEKYCVACHDSSAPMGSLDLTRALGDDQDRAVHQRWVRIFDRVAANEMPPSDEPRPNSQDQQEFLTKLQAKLTAAHSQEKATVLRRLNRREYQNSLNELLGTHVNILDLLPDDGRAYGFDNIGDALSLSGIQLQRLMEAAEIALNAALHQIQKPERTLQRFTLESERNQNNYGKHWLKLPDGATVVFNNGSFPSTQIPNLRAKTAGEYRLRVRGYGFQIHEPVVFALIAGSFERGGDVAIRSFHQLPIENPGIVEATLYLDQGESIKISPQGLNGPDGHSPVKDGPDRYPGEGLAIQDIELDGPIVGDWPPRGKTLLIGDAFVREVAPEKAYLKTKRGYQPVFVADSPDPVGDFEKNLPKFLSAAFRRPVDALDVAPYFQIFKDEFELQGDYLAAVKTAAIAALCSPDFLYLRETPGKLSSLQLASRLSYFLARTAPDNQLLAADLSNIEVLRRQTERLLSSPGLERFIVDFTDGWLNLREIEFTTPDKLLYPEYDELLLDSMLRETRSFIGELIQHNLSVSHLIHSDFAMLNARLARHYGLPDVEGLDIRKTSLPKNSQRGGLLTQASILKVSANGTNTSPVVRGVWVMDRLLGMEPPPPPPGIPGVEPDIRGATTLRQLLEKHRSIESCNACHRVIDPPGFALENYDVIGGWRDRFRSIEQGEQVKRTVEGRKVRYRLGPAVDAAGELSDGRTFSNFQEFQQLLLADQDRVARCVTEKLLTFATGRGLGFSDRPEMERLVAESKQRNHRLRDLIHAVVQSPIFTCK